MRPVKEPGVTNSIDALILDLLEWIGPEPRAYAEVMEAWRTSCPRLPVWEEANARGLLERRHEPGKAAMVALSASGRSFLVQRRPNIQGTAAISR